MSSEPAAEAALQPVPETVEKTTEPAATAVETKPTEQQSEAAVDTAVEKPTAAATAPLVEAPAENTTTVAPESDKKDEVVDKKDEPQAPAKPTYLTKVPGLNQFFESLPGIMEKTGHKEMWGVPLKDSNDIPTVNVLIKFLRANEGNVKLAEEQLAKALEWRKEINPIELASNARFSAKKSGGLGYITSYIDPAYGETIFTWNIYGGVKDLKSTFGDLDEFIRWRTALMERGVQELKLNEATEVVEYDGEDRYQMLQVHDYKGVSFLRMDPTVRAASKKTIEVFSTAYPELLREKFFINVPTIMGWMFGAMKVFLSKNTIRKFHPISNGANLGKEFSFVEDLPKSYGGQGAELDKAGRTIPLIDDIPAGEPAQAATQAGKEEAVKKAETVEQSTKADAEPSAAPAPVVTEASKEDAVTQEIPKEEPAKTEETSTAKSAEEVAAAAPATEESK